MPVLNISHISSTEAVKSKNHNIFKRLTCFPVFFIMPLLSEEVAHAVKFLRHASYFIVCETQILWGKKVRDCIRILLGFLPPMLGWFWLVATLYNNGKCKVSYKLEIERFASLKNTYLFAVPVVNSISQVAIMRKSAARAVRTEA